MSTPPSPPPSTQLIERAGLLLRHPGARLALGVGAACLAALGAVPLSATPGWAHALALNAILGPLAWALGLAAATRELQIDALRPVEGVGLHLRRPLDPLWSLALPALSAAGLTLLLGVIAFALTTLWAWLRGGLCDLWGALAWYPLLIAPSILLGGALGVALGLLAPRWWQRALASLALWGGTLAVAAWPTYFGPQAFAYHHLLGYLPGPLYDERVAFEAPILGYRALTLAWAGLSLSLGAVLCAPRPLRPGPPRPLSPGGRWLGALAGLGVIALQFFGEDLGFRTSFEALDQRLGGQRALENIVLHYPSEWEEARVERLAIEAAQRLAAVEDWLGAGPPPAPYQVWLFRDAEEKRRAIGAGRTSIAKPWLGATFLHDQGEPHPSLKHELAHLVAAAWAPGPLKISARWGVIPNDGLIEGLAVAADWPQGARGPHDWARALRAAGLSPRPQGLFQGAGLRLASAGRAYTLAGSMLRWLADTQGIEALQRAYQAGSLTALGDSEALLQGWEAFLDSAPPSPQAQAAAAERFRRGALFARPCALALDAAQREAEAARQAGDYEAAVTAHARCAALDPGDPWRLIALARAHEEAGAPAQAAQAIEAALSHPNRGPALAAEGQLRHADLAWRAGELGPALEGYDLVAAAAEHPQRARLAAAKALLARDPDLGPALLPFLLADLPPAEGLSRLYEAQARHPGQGLIPYLIGRQLWNAEAYAAALPYLSQAHALSLSPAGGLASENLRLIATAHQRLGDWDACAFSAARLARAPWAAPDAQAVGADLATLCRFAAARARGPNEAAERSPEPSASGR